MSKIHLKAEPTRVIAIAAIILSILIAVINIIMLIATIITVTSKPSASQDNIAVQRQNINDAIEILSEKTIPIDNQK